MTREQFLQWGARWHYPQLVIAPDRVLRSGERFYSEASPTVIMLASRRIQKWNARVPAELVTNAIERVDFLLSKNKEVQQCL